MSDEFNPQERVIRIQGGAVYLQVKDRLIWARHEHPDLCVQTDVVRLDDTIAVFKAEVLYFFDGEWVRGTGHGSETPQGFPAGYIEKAETVALGRALAAIGYGTAAAFEEELGGKIADAPVSQPTRPQPRDSAPAPGHDARARMAAQAQPQTGGITPEQMATITNILGELGIGVTERVRKDVPGKDALSMLTHQEGAKMVQQLAKEKAEHRAAKKARAAPEAPALLVPREISHHVV